MNLLSTSLFLATAVATTASAQAQDKVPIDESGTALNLMVSASSSFSGSNKMKNGSSRIGELSSREFETSISGTIPLSQNDSLGVGIGLSTIELDYSLHNMAPRSHMPLPDELNRASFDLSWIHQFNDQWSSLLAVSPGVHWSDGKLGSDAFAVSGVVGAIYKQSATLNWMFGIAYDSMSHNHSILPAAGVEWSPSEQWTLAFGFPRTAVSYHVSPVLTVSLVAEGQRGTYHVAKDPLKNQFGERDHLLDDSTLEYFDGRIGVEAAYRVSDRCSLTATVGSVLYREAKYHKTGVRIAKFKADDDASAYGSLGMTLSF